MSQQKKVKPVLLAMVVCDQVIRDEESKKISLVGLFNRIKASAFPCIHNTLHVFIAVAEYEGTAECKLNFLDNESNILVTLSGPLQFPDKLAIVEMNFCMKNLLIPKAGLYHFDFIVNEEIVGHRKFVVESIESKEKYD